MKQYTVLRLAAALLLAAITSTVMAAQSVSGTVYDSATSEPLPGATVSVKGTSAVTATDADGNFTLRTDRTSGTIQVTYIGYVPASKNFKAGEHVTVLLREDNRMLDEVVVIGYGVQRKSDLTGSVSSVDPDDLKSIPATNVIAAMQGKVSGVEIVQNSGAPGASNSIRIRGMGTVNDSDPLYVVDGIMMDNIDHIATEDIASIEVLKDAASAAIYGSRAANGVVLLTTKSGEKSTKRLNISANISGGFMSVANAPSILPASDYARFSDYVHNAHEYTVISPDGQMNLTEAAQAEVADGSDWWQLATRTGSTGKASLALSGGDKNLNYYVSGNYLKTNGIVRQSGYERLSFNGKINASLADCLKLGVQAGYSREQRDVVSEGTRGVIKSAITYNPLMPIYDLDGGYTYLTPVENLRRLGHSRDIDKITGQVKLDWTIIKPLLFSTRASYLTERSDIDRMERSRSSEEVIGTNYFDVKKNPVTANTFSWDNILTWMPELHPDHNLTIMAGQTMEIYRQNSLNSSGRGYGGYDDEFNSLGFAAFEQATNSATTGYTSLGLLSRISYNLLNRYLVQVNFRADASSRFAKKNRWGYFPSISAGWRLDQEPWLRDQSWLSMLKIRAGWGQLGNNRIPNLAWLSLISYGKENYIYGVGTPSLKPGYALTSYGNPDIKWERTESTTAGIDFNMFGNRFTSSIEYFVKDTKDMLLEVPIVYSAGWASTPWQNAGSVRNQGFEIQAGWNDRIGDFGYGISGNFSHVRNHVTSLGQYGEPILGGNLKSPNNLGYVTRTVLNAPIGAFYGYICDGIMQESDFDTAGKPRIPVKQSAYAYNPGDRKYVDINGDGVIDDNDLTTIGNPHPDFYYAFNLNLSYRNFDLQMFFQGVHGNEIFNASKYFLYSNVTYNGSWTSDYDFSNVASDYFQRVYRPENVSGYRAYYGPNPGGDVPVPSSVSSRSSDNFAASDWYIEDGSYLRCKQIQLTYTFPASLTKRMRMQSVKAYASVSNPFTITGYSGMDPEIGKTVGEEANTAIGIDQGTYPQARTWMFGIMLDF